MEKGAKKGQILRGDFLFGSIFPAKATSGPFPKKGEILGSLRSGPKAAFGRPGCLKGAQKGAF